MSVNPCAAHRFQFQLQLLFEMHDPQSDVIADRRASPCLMLDALTDRKIVTRVIHCALCTFLYKNETSFFLCF